MPFYKKVYTFVKKVILGIDIVSNRSIIGSVRRRKNEKKKTKKIS
jgi:hypothetical protein